MPESSERIQSTDTDLIIGSGFRQARLMRVRAGRMRAVLIVQSYQGNSEIFVTLEELRAVAKWTTRRVKQADRENRRERLKKLIRFDFS